MLCDGMGAQCGDNSCCTGLGASCGAGSICTGMNTACGHDSDCFGIMSRCASGSRCHSKLAQCNERLRAGGAAPENLEEAGSMDSPSATADNETLLEEADDLLEEVEE